jgi:hypothetical protein
VVVGVAHKQGLVEEVVGSTSVQVVVVGEGKLGPGVVVRSRG